MFDFFRLIFFTPNNVHLPILKYSMIILQETVKMFSKEAFTLFKLRR